MKRKNRLKAIVFVLLMAFIFSLRIVISNATYHDESSVSFSSPMGEEKNQIAIPIFASSS